MERFLEWLGGTAWSVMLLESFWVWPLLESTHVLTLALFVGMVVVNDLRLVGLTLKSVPVSQVTERVLWWAKIGFLAMVVTGVLLFYSNPSRYYHNIFFRLKMGLLVIAGLNAFVFHRKIHQRVADWDNDFVLPREARMAGALSLAAWFFIVIAGRLIAYNWFDCDIQPQPDWVNWAASCPVVGD